jgi:plastocyanin
MRNPRKSIALLIACAAITTSAALAGCGGSDSSSTTASPTSEPTSTAAAGGAAAVKTDKVDIADYKFAPETIEVDAGTKVTWTNSDATAHTATADDSSFDTGDLDKGDSATVTFDKPGDFTYYCRFHPFMKATVEVK